MGKKNKYSRRSFITKMSGSVLSMVALSPLGGANAKALQSAIFRNKEDTAQKIRIGIIGAENTHTVIYGQLFNIEKRFPGIHVQYVWGETEAFAKNAMDKGRIPYMVKDPREMLGKIDALIVDQRHAKYHLPAALPFIKRKIPTFIDKPFCYRALKGKEFLEIARKYGTPVTSYSSSAYSKSTMDIKKQVDAYPAINQVTVFGPTNVESKWGGVFFYAVHMVQTLMTIFGEDIAKVRITRDGDKANATLLYGKSGLWVTLVFSPYFNRIRFFVETESGFHELESRVYDADPPIAYRDMVQMFKTGDQPRSYQSILNCVSVLEAMERSTYSQAWEEVRYVKID